jgi:hypothetical protein
VISASTNAETLSFSSFRIEVEDGWTYSSDRGEREIVNFFRSDGNGTLKLQTMDMPAIVSAEVLRNMTNVSHDVPLTWQSWGDYSGYQYDYSEGNLFYRQWWLARETEILLVVFVSNALSDDIEIEVTNRMVNSISVINP